MGLVRQIAISVSCVSFAVFVSFFGSLPVFRRTPIGLLNRTIWIHLPNGLTALDRIVTGGRLALYVRRTERYLMHEKHPIVLIFFLALLVGSDFLFLLQALPLLRVTFAHSPGLLFLQYGLIVFLVPLPYIFLRLSQRTSSNIDGINHSSALRAYPYDHTIFHQPGPGYGPFAPPCRTCNRAKPARSKHCSICRACVQKADHHCVWINNCVGRANYIYFLGLMLSVSLLLAYGAYLGYRILDTQIQLQHQQRRRGRLASPESDANPKIHWSRDQTWRSYAAIFSERIALHPLIAAPSLLALLSFPLAASLFVYHIYLIWAGMTTNESGKWADLREDIRDGLVWRARLDELTSDFPALGRNHNWNRNQNPFRSQSQSGGGAEDNHGSSWPLSPSWVVIRTDQPGQRPRVRRKRVGTGAYPPPTTAARAALPSDGDDKNNFNAHSNSALSGPDSNSRHRNGQNQHGNNHWDQEPEPDPDRYINKDELWTHDDRWSQVGSLTEIENIYDLGFWDNLRDTLWNRS